MRIELSRCVVRSLHTNDAAALIRHGSRRDIWIDLSGDSSLSQPVRERWLQKALAAKPESFLVIEADNEAVGVVGFCRQDGPNRLSAQMLAKRVVSESRSGDRRVARCYGVRAKQA